MVKIERVGDEVVDVLIAEQIVCKTFQWKKKEHLLRAQSETWDSYHMPLCAYDSVGPNPIPSQVAPLTQIDLDGSTHFSLTDITEQVRDQVLRPQS